MADLSIYKASAGSGKTFQLTGEYLKLIFSPGTEFSRILAVTFTNKATAEMRERILHELYILSKADNSKHIDSLIEHTKLSASEIQKKAVELLHRILHNYSRFNISTIDSFFQRILKAFTREIGLNVGFNIELNAKPIIEKAVDGLFDDIEDNKELKLWLQDYAFSKVQDGNSWDIHKDLIDFSNSSFSEVFYSFDEAHLDSLSDIKVFKTLRKELDEIVGGYIDKAKNYGEQFFQIMEKHQLTVDDFSSKKSGVAGYFVFKLQKCTTNTFDLPGKRVHDAANSPDYTAGWVAKSSPIISEVTQCVQSGLQNIASEFVAFTEKESILFYSALAVRKNINVFAVLVEIFKRVLNHCNDNNLFLLPLASPFLAKIIEDDDAPFIYEKTGEYLNHFMIDEFQDTSHLQWKNFSPLISNGISQGKTSLVVGDVKQSIYRWRNSDWGLLDHGVANQYRNFNVQEINLEYNWRSDKNIVQFNNWCFSKGSNILQQEIEADIADIALSDAQKEMVSRLYLNGEQNVPPVNKDTTGFVQVKFFENEESYDDVALNYMTSALEDLANKGFQPKDIAILVRKNTEGAKVAKYLMEKRKQNPEKENMFRFVSNDSVFLGSSDAIMLIVSLMAYLNTPGSIILKAKILQLYYAQTKDVNKASEMLSTTKLSNEDEFLATLPKEFKEMRDSFKYMTLVDMAFNLIRIFITDTAKDYESRSDMPFIHTFQDAILNYTNHNGNDIAGFIEWWENKGAETPINLSDEQNAIRIMTIHKSKGLEFKAVIIPFAGWKFEPRDALLWCSLDEYPFNKFNLLPISYSSKLKNTFFKNEYIEERLKSIVDNLNLLYVALTRAEKALYVLAPIGTKKPGTKAKKLSTVADLLASLISSDNINNGLPEGENNWNDEALLFEYGELPSLPIYKEEELVQSTEMIQYGNYKKKLKIRLQGKEIFELDNSQSINLKNRGNIYHKIFEFIKYEKDILLAVNRAVGMGLIDINDRESIVKEIKGFIANSEVNDWFSNTWKIKTERSILLNNGDVKRPDRVIENENEIVIIDYKFTKEQKAQHLKQVCEYIDALSELTTKQVKGFVWYVSLQEVRPVK